MHPKQLVKPRSHAHSVHKVGYTSWLKISFQQGPCVSGDATLTSITKLDFTEKESPSPAERSWISEATAMKCSLKCVDLRSEEISNLTSENHLTDNGIRI